MSLKITDMTPAGSVSGSELIPADVSTAPRSVTPANIKDYTIDQIEAIAAGSSVTGSDGIFVLQGGVLKPMDIDIVAQHAIDTVWGKGAEASPDDADVMALKDGGATEKTVTLVVLAEYIRATIEAAILDVSDLADGSGTLATTDFILVTQGTTAKQITVQNLYDAIYTGLVTYVTGLSAISSPVDTDSLYVIRGSTGYEITLAQIATHAAASAAITGSGTTDQLAQWSSSSVLQAGPAVVTSVAGFAAGSDVALPTSKAVRDEMDEVINDATAIGAALAGTDTILVDDGANGTQRKSALSRVWTYILALLVAVTDVSSYSWVLDEDAMGSDDATKVPTQQSTKAYVDAEVVKVSNLDIDGTADIGAALAGVDLLVVDDGAGGTNRKCAVSRIKTFVDTVGTYRTLWVPAKDMTPATTSGCAALATVEYGTNDQDHAVLAFAGAAADEHADFDLVMPEAWDRGTIKFRVYWTNGHGDANPTEYVEFYMAAGARSDDDALDAVLGTPVNVEDQSTADDDLQITVASAALTVGGTPALLDLIHFKLSRDYDHAGAGSAMDVDAYVLGVLIQYQENLAVSAW